jgi:hypothetical protein
MNTSARPEANRRILLFLVLLAAVLFLGSILFIISRAQT